MDFLYFIVLVGVLVFVHESGHFMWAKLFGVPVLKFSLGFGPKIAGFRRGETHYVVAAVPLGGYVRMLGETPRDEVPEEHRSAAFDAQPLWKRIIIVCAGPAMNLAFPVLLYFVVFLGSTAHPPAVVGQVLPDQPAEGKLQAGDRIVAIDDDPIHTFYDVTRAVRPRAGQSLRFSIERQGAPMDVTITPELTRVERHLELVDEVGLIGILLAQPLAVIGVSDPKGPAAAAQLETFDVVLSAGGKPTERWLDLRRRLDRNRGGTVPLTVLRPEPAPGALGTLLGVHAYQPRVAMLTPEAGTDAGPERAGLEPADLFVSHVVPGSPEAKAGLRVGDRVVSLGGEPVRHWTQLRQRLMQAPDREQKLVVRRDGQLYELRYHMRREQGVSEFGEPYDRPLLGFAHWQPSLSLPPVDNPNPVRFAVSEAMRYTAEVVELTFFSFVRLLQGRLTIKSLGGPLTIFDVAGEAAREGALNYLFLMGFISINLGLINLLPIPLLDGGHLLFFGIEAVTRRPLSLKVREYASMVGLTVLVLIMVFAFKNDVERQWPQIVRSISGGP